MEDRPEEPEQCEMPDAGESLFDLQTSLQIRKYTIIVGFCSFFSSLLLNHFTTGLDILWWGLSFVSIFCLVQVVSNYPHYGKKRWGLVSINDYLKATVGQDTMYLSGRHSTYRPNHTLFAQIIQERLAANKTSVWALVHTRTNLASGRSYDVVLGPIVRSRI